MTAVFGGLFGLATIASIVALLIQGVPPAEERDQPIAAEEAEPEVVAPPPPDTPESRKPKRQAIPGPWRIKDMANDPDIVIVTGEIERKAFVTALQDKGVPKAEVYRVLKAFEGVRSFDKTKRNDRFVVAMNRAGRKLRAFEYEISPLEIYQAKEDENNLLKGDRLDMKLAENEIAAAFYIGPDITKSYPWGGLEDGILDEIDDALNGRISTESFEEGGTVRLIAKEVTALGLFAKYKHLVAFEYRPANPSDPPVRAYWYEGEKTKGYFDDRGRQPFSGGWRSPCPGAPVTSRFNPKRMHPILKRPMPHNGTDFGAPSGTPVYSAYRGTVVFVGNAGASGNLVSIEHPNGVTTGYAHLLKFQPGIKNGMKVGTHAIIGYVGSTGRSTGPHLHFSAKRDGKFFDAETLRMDGVRVMPTVDRPGFLARKAELDLRLDGIPLPDPPPELPPEPKADPASDDPASDDSASDKGGDDKKGDDKKGDEKGDGEKPKKDGDKKGDDKSKKEPAAAKEGDDSDEGDTISGPDLSF